MTKEIVADLCIGEQSCNLAASSTVFGEPCPVIEKNLKVQVACKGRPNLNYFRLTYKKNASSQPTVILVHNLAIVAAEHPQTFRLKLSCENERQIEDLKTVGKRNHIRASCVLVKEHYGHMK
jgi:hypothetical protein